MKKAKVIKWTANNGNPCFLFSERRPFERPWIIVLIIILLLGIIGIEYIVYGRYDFLFPVFVIFFFAFFWWLVIPMRWNEKIIEYTVHEIMDDYVNKDAELAGTKVKKSFVHYDTKGTYGIIKGRCFLVLLKNGDVWEYPIEYHKPIGDGERFYECQRNYIVSVNKEHILSINPKRWSRLVAAFSLSNNTKLWFLILAILVVGGLSSMLLYWLVQELQWWLLLIILCYMGLYSLIVWISNKFENRFLNIIEKIISIPVAVSCFLIEISHPFMTIIGTYVFVALYAFVLPSFVLIGLSLVGWIDMKSETITFIIFTFGSILCSHSYNATKWIIHQTPLRDWGNHAFESYREALAVYLIHPTNMVFLLYLLYFVFLCMSGFMQIQYDGYLISKAFDGAILKAFLVFIAFSNMRVKSREAEVDAKVLLQKSLLLFEHDKNEY